MFEELVKVIKRVVRRNQQRRINKEKFIAIVTRQLEKEHKGKDGVFIAEFLEARQIYEDFKKAGCFDENGYLKPLPKAV